MAAKIILDEQGVLNLLEEIKDNGKVNLRYYLNEELESYYHRFVKKLQIIKENFPDNYIEFVNNINSNYIEFKERVKTVLLYMCVLKKYGIELEDGTFRNFDFFDFYLLKNRYFENFYKKDLIPILEELIKENRGTRLNIDNIFEIRYLINTTTGEYCSDNYNSIDLPISKELILNQKDELDINEKEYLITFMENNGIPFTLGNYRFGVMKMLKQRNTTNNLFDLNIYLDCNARVRKK